MQLSIDAFENGFLRQANAYIHISYSEISNRMKVVAQKVHEVRLLFPKAFGKLLGVNPAIAEKPIGNERDAFKYKVDLNAPFGRLDVYSDFADLTNIGDVTAPILRVVPFQPFANTSHFHFEFVNLHYVPVAKSAIEQVKISIKGDTGNGVPFCTGKTLTELHFRQKL